MTPQCANIKTFHCFLAQRREEERETERRRRRNKITNNRDNLSFRHSSWVSTFFQSLLVTINIHTQQSPRATKKETNLPLSLSPPLLRNEDEENTISSRFPRRQMHRVPSPLMREVFNVTKCYWHWPCWYFRFYLPRLLFSFSQFLLFAS